VIRRAATALAVVFVLAHLPFLPSSLEDIDSVNFALGVRDFDIAQHRPHPPGYPVYIAVAKAAVAIADVVVETPRQSAREAKAMAVISLVSAVVAILLLFRLFACFADEGIALAATALTAACPLFWYMAVRPMSDMAGLAAALASLVCAARAWTLQVPDSRYQVPVADSLRISRIDSGQMIVLGALLAAIAIGFRSQNAMVTLPFLGAVLMDRVGKGVAGPLLGGSMAFAMGVLGWCIPLVVASGGLNAYLAALGSQAGEDFAGVEMLYLNPSPRLAADALVRTLIYPWDSPWLGGIVLALTVAGAGVLLARDRRALIAVFMMTAPYLVFHLLFHDMDFVRYALPLIPAVAFLAVTGVASVARQAALPIVGALAIWAVMIATPAAQAYAAEPSPVVRVLEAMDASPIQISIREMAVVSGGRVLAMHQSFQRPLEAETVHISQRLPSPPRREWLELVRYWRQGEASPVWFLADPRRTDLALVDPHSRSDRRDFGWRFVSLSNLGGMRPAAVQWYRLAAPGWFAEEGWALTPETAGVAQSMQRGPHLAPIVAWVRRRPGRARMMIGGRHLGGPQDPTATFTATIDGRQLVTWESKPGFFVHVFDIPAGTLAGEGLARLEIASAAPGGSSVATAIEQFDLQDAGSLMWGYGEGWHEAEYSPRRGLWHWTSERATLRLIDASTPVAVRLHIESPLRYFDEAPHVRLSAGGRVFAEATPDSDFVLEGVIPLDALRAANGLVTLETDRAFVPAERGGPPDRRRLGLRVFGVDVSIRN
jgi:hypothetical protein